MPWNQLACTKSADYLSPLCNPSTCTILLGLVALAWYQGNLLGKKLWAMPACVIFFGPVCVQTLEDKVGFRAMLIPGISGAHELMARLKIGRYHHNALAHGLTRQLLSPYPRITKNNERGDQTSRISCGAETPSRASYIIRVQEQS